MLDFNKDVRPLTKGYRWDNGVVAHPPNGEWVVVCPIHEYDYFVEDANREPRLDGAPCVSCELEKLGRRK